MLSEDNKIILVITHDIEFIKTICSSALILKRGEIVKEISEKEMPEIEKYLLGGD